MKIVTGRIPATVTCVSLQYHASSIHINIQFAVNCYVILNFSVFPTNFHKKHVLNNLQIGVSQHKVGNSHTNS